MSHGRNASAVRIVRAAARTKLQLVAKSRGTTCVCGWAVDIARHDAQVTYVVAPEDGGADAITNMRVVHRRCA